MATREDELDGGAAPLIEHLAELRTRIIRCVIAFLIAMVACFIIADPVLDFLASPLESALRERGLPSQLIFTAPQEKFFVLIRISVLMGLAVSFPVIAHQMWRFVAPGLYRQEKNAFLPFIISSPLLFLAGAAFAHYVVTPLAMNFFVGFSDLIPTMAALLTGVESPDTGVSTIILPSVRESLDITLKFIFAFGICFQLPVLLTLLGKAGLVSAVGLKSVRKYAVVAILLVAALVTPPDVVTQIILFTVVYALYEVSIQLVAMVERSREKRLRAEGLWFEDDDEEEAAASESEKS